MIASICLLVLVLSLGQTYASWSDTQKLAVTAVSTGDLQADVALATTQSQPGHFVSMNPVTFAPVFPAQERNLDVTVAGLGSGNALRWKFKVDLDLQNSTLTAAEKAFVTGSVKVRGCGATSGTSSENFGTWITCVGSSGQGLVVGESNKINVALTYKLGSDAPTTIQGKTINPQFVITVAQHIG